jgi:hypothetical protein
VARAKRTERAEARRRYRSATAASPELVEEGDVLETPEIPAAALPRGYRDRRAPSPAAASTPPQRGSFAGTIRQSVGAVDIPGDLRALPKLLLSRAFTIPAAIIGGTVVVMLIPTLGANQMVSLAGNLILQPPPMIIAFLAGMLATRAAWLMGGLVSVLAGIGFVIVVWVNTDMIVTPLGFTYLATTDQKLAYAMSVMLTAPIFGIAVGAFAGFYRRFLNASQPQRQGARRR